MFVALDHDKENIVAIIPEYVVNPHDTMTFEIEDDDNLYYLLYELGKTNLYLENGVVVERLTDEEIAQREILNNISDLNDALIEIADITADNEVSMSDLLESISDINDALIELANIVSE